MKKEIDSKHIASVCSALMSGDAKSAVKYLDEKTIVRATWHNKPMSRNRLETMVVTIGAPNYLERAFIKKCNKNGLAIKFPCSYTKPWPKKVK
jgi:hypothetical protein